MRRIVLLAFIVAMLVVTVAAQLPPPQRVTTNSRPRRNVEPATTTTPSALTTRGNIDENFELNITERRITERDFFASTAIELGETSARGLSLRVGVAVGASEIDVLLRNVRGSVRFRASLEALQRVLDTRRPMVAPQPSVPRTFLLFPKL